MTDRRDQVLVVGGGIGGLAAALALRRLGAEVTLFEQAPALSEVGAGLQVSPNGLRVIEALGLGSSLRRRSVAGGAVSLRDGLSGREVVRLDLTRLPSDQSYLFVHRADLVDVLAQAVREAGVVLRLGAAITSVRPGGVPEVTTADGQVFPAQLVVAADGLHSVARPVLNGASAPFFTGQVAWRATVPNTSNRHPAEARVHMGPGRHVVSYPLREGTLVNLVAVEERSDWAAEGWNHTDDPVHLRAAFADFGPDLRAMIERVETPLLWGLFRHPVATHWGQGGVALLGDAAHPTLPFLAQGANMALEDAWVLARAFERFGPSDKMLETYQSARRGRVSRVIDAANGNAWKYHLHPGPLRWAAHLGLRVGGAIAPDRMLRQFDWLYGYDVTKVSI